MLHLPHGGWADMLIPSKNMRLRVLYHGNCFDGCSSAGVFTRFYRERVAKGPVEVVYRPLEHKGSPQPFAPDFFDGDENACVDFRYSQDPRLTWWFDHHASAFQLPGDEDHFRADATGRKFYDPAAKSCTKFLANTVAAKFGFDEAPLAELIEWAEIIDGALFQSAKMAVELKEPALRLMTFIENNRQPEIAERFIADLVSRPLGDIAADAYVAEPLKPLLEQHAAQHRDHPDEGEAGRQRRVLRSRRSGDGGVQQVHFVLPVPGGPLFGRGDAGVARQDLDRGEPLVEGAADARDQQDLRALRRRRPPGRGRDLDPARRIAARPRDRPPRSSPS